MKTVRIITAIITLFIFLCCLSIGILAAIQGGWMVSIVIFLMAGLMSYFVINDYLKFIK